LKIQRESLQAWLQRPFPRSIYSCPAILHSACHIRETNIIVLIHGQPKAAVGAGRLKAEKKTTKSELISSYCASERATNSLSVLRATGLFRRDRCAGRFMKPQVQLPSFLSTREHLFTARRDARALKCGSVRHRGPFFDAVRTFYFVLN